ncbi:MAG: DegT/DnrJ/EryC1/StrS family aminotransferase [Pirellulales bacterium]|nr:DegT/DnrJ/EryC1/StrS family aminotransferase [Pirellulales bacterium]
MPQLALRGGPATKTKPFPQWPIFDERERTALLEVLESRVWWRTPGTRTLKFEQDFAAYHQAKHGIAITNGTHAIEVVLAALGVGPGDEVIVPDSTFVATASAVLFAGAMPVMVDICRDTECIDPDLVEAAITPRTKGIIAVHLGGHPADLDRLNEIAARHSLFLVEDCAHAHGSEWRGKKVGTHGICGTFSFQSSKLMTAGEGGLIITNDDEFERKARSAHDCGRLPGEWFYAHFSYGSNYRLSEWQGAVLSAQLTRLDEQTSRRHANAQLLDRLLAEIPGVTPQRCDERCTRNGHYAYIFRYHADAFGGAPTEKFIAAMKAEGIPNQAAYPPVHDLALFQNGSYRHRLCGDQARQDHAFLRAAYPNTKSAAWESYWLPQYALLGDEQDMREVAAAIRKIQAHAAELAG